jgi:hypothetical protein
MTVSVDYVRSRWIMSMGSLNLGLDEALRSTLGKTMDSMGSWARQTDSSMTDVRLMLINWLWLL